MTKRVVTPQPVLTLPALRGTLFAALALIGASAFAQLPIRTAAAQAVRVSLADSVVPSIAKSRALGPVPGGETIDVAIGLQPRDLAGLQAFADAVSDPNSSAYRRFITPQEVGARFGASASDREALVGYLASKGVAVTLVSPNGMALLAQGTAANLQNAFGTTLANYQGRDPSGKTITFRANTTALSVPAAIANAVVCVSGLDTYHRPMPRASTSTLTPALSSAAYGLTGLNASGYYGQGRRVAISNFDGYRLSNATRYITTFNLPVPAAGAGTNITVQAVGTNPAGPGTAAAEGDLDIQMVLAGSPLADIRIYDGRSSELAVLTQEAADNWADVITESYGWSYDGSIANSAHAQHLSMTAQGITYLAASGDSGTNFYDSDSGLYFAYPDYDPEVLNVGGTIATLDASTGARIGEIGWNYSGGGWYNSASNVTFNTRPAYQQGSAFTTQNVFGGATPPNRRLIPDVAFQAAANNSSSFNPGGQYIYYVYQGTQQLITIDGTSESSPLFAGLLATTEGRLFAPYTGAARQRLGRVQDVIYAQNGRADVYRDMTIGTNGSLPGSVANGSNGLTGPTSNAVPGWDYVTGWGSMDMGAFLNALLPRATVSLTFGSYDGAATPLTSIPVEVQFRTPGSTTAISTQTVYPAADGTLNVKAPGVGTFDVSIKASHWLRRTVASQTFTTNGTTGFSATLVNGDVNGDNAITAFDRASVSNALGSSVGDAAYSVNADLNGDGAVTAFDRAIVSNNLGASGDN